ncbi:Integrase catalytic subunit [Pseudomonas syringae pv. berberidis]|nr:Integrase catalytic subunit [Pseudomonas syringae pv. berberidis]
MSYTELSIEERVTIQIGQYRDLSQREIARLLGRSPSTISRKLRRNPLLTGGYAACEAQALTRERRKVCCPARKLVPGSERLELIIHLLRERFSPEQIAGKLRVMKIDFEEAYVCRETIDNVIYALPMGELRKELIVSASGQNHPQTAQWRC